MKKITILYLVVISALFFACNNEPANNCSNDTKQTEPCKLVGIWEGTDGYLDFVYYYNEDGTFVHKLIINGETSIDYIGTYEYDDEKSQIHLVWRDCITNSTDPEYKKIAAEKQKQFRNPLRYSETIKWLNENSYIPELNGINILKRVE